MKRNKINKKVQDTLQETCINISSCSNLIATTSRPTIQAGTRLTTERDEQELIAQRTVQIVSVLFKEVQHDKRHKKLKSAFLFLEGAFCRVHNPHWHGAVQRGKKSLCGILTRMLGIVKTNKLSSIFGTASRILSSITKIRTEESNFQHLLSVDILSRQNFRII